MIFHLFQIISGLNIIAVTILLCHNIWETRAEGQVSFYSKFIDFSLSFYMPISIHI